MSEVWAAQDLELQRTVAVKLLAPDADPTRFEREARAVAALSHPAVAALFDYGEAAGRRYIVFEYLPGGSLADRLAAGRPLPDADTRRIASQIAAGLARAHEHGLVHRDLKPSNILFDAEGRAKIADFGIAQMGGPTGATEAGTVLGTATVISPEQAAGREATPASDVYAFGVMLFAMLTGRLPFEAPDAITVAAMHRDLQPPPVSELRPDAPPLLESLAAAALAKSPADRPADGAALAAELGSFAPAARDTALTQVLPPVRHSRGRTAAVLLGAAALAAAGVAVAVAVTSHGGGPAIAPSTSTPAPVSTGGAVTPAPPAETAEEARTVPPAPTSVPSAPSTTPAAAPTTAAATAATEPTGVPAAAGGLPPPGPPTTAAAPTTSTTATGATGTVSTVSTTTVPAPTTSPATTTTAATSTTASTTTSAGTTTTATTTSGVPG